MKFTAASYKFLKTVNFSGYTFSFAVAAEDENNIVYTFCDTDSSAEDAKDNQSEDAGKGESSDDRSAREESEKSTAAGENRTQDTDNGWTPLTALEFPGEFRPIGMTLLTRSGAPAASTEAPFEIVIDNINLWIIRRTSDATSLLADRFIFDTGAKQLVKANEVCFARSGNPDLPATDRDTYASKDLDGNAFVEPTFLLQLNPAEFESIDATSCDDSTAALLIPDASNPKRGRWHFFLNNGNGILNHYTISYTEFAWFDLTDVGLNSEAVSLVDNSTGVISALDTLGAQQQSNDPPEPVQLRYPSATVYEQQETAFTQIGEAQSVKRAVRAVLSCHATVESQTVLAVFDFSIGLDGHLTSIPSGSLTVGSIEDYNTVLKFDGRGDSVSSNSSFNITTSSFSFLVSCWIRWDGPSASQTKQAVISLVPVFPAHHHEVPMALKIDTKGQPYLRVGFGSQAVITGQAPLIPGQWVNLSFGISLDSELKVQLWLNGFKLATDSVSVDDVSLPTAFRLWFGGVPEQNLDGTAAKHFFNGAFGQFYIWTPFVNFEESLLGLHQNYIYNQNNPTTTRIFLKFNEGQGTTLTDSSTRGQNCTINGATWEPDVCPAQSSMPVVALDNNFLDIRATLLNPTANGSLPAVPVTGCAPSFMNSGDGLLHLYYRSGGNTDDLADKAVAVHMSTSAERARFIVFQEDATYQGDETSGETSQPDETSSDELTQMLTLVSRQAGRGGGMIDVSFGNIIDDGSGKDVFDTVTFEYTDTGTSYPFSESWENVPVRLDEFTQVINGLAAIPGPATTSELVVAINCGGLAVAGTSYQSDEDYSRDSRYAMSYCTSSTHLIDTTNISSPAPQAVYQSERNGNSEDVAYVISTALEAGKNYKIRLHFCEEDLVNSDVVEDIGDRLFNIKINDRYVQQDFDIYQEAGGKNRALVKEYAIYADNNGQITIIGEYTGPQSPKFNGIEIYSLPPVVSDSSESSEQIEAEHGQIVYDYANNVTLILPSGETPSLPDSAFASRLFEVFPNQELLDQNPVPSLQAQDNLSITVFAGRDCGWLKMPLQPCMQFTGSTVAYVDTSDPDTPAPDLDIPGDLTVQCWLFMPEAPESESMIAIFRGDQASYALSINSDQQLVAYRFGFFPLESEAADYYGVSRSSVVSSLDTNKWVHAAAVYTSSYGLHLPNNVYIDCGHGKNVDITEAITIEAWVKFDNNDPGTADIVSKTSYESGQSSYVLRVVPNSSGDRYLKLKIYQDDGTHFSSAVPFTTSPGTWKHLAATCSPDHYLNYLEFETDDENYVTLDQLTADPMTTFTVEMFIKPKDDDRQVFIAYNFNSQQENENNYFIIWYNKDNTDHDNLCITVNNTHYNISSKSWTTDGKWQFLSTVVETNNSQTFLTVYIDGVIAKKTDGDDLLQQIVPIPLGSDSILNPWMIGATDLFDQNESYFGGYMDAYVSEVRIWNTARSEAEILSTLKMPLTGKESGLEAYLLFKGDPNFNQSTIVNRVTGNNCSINTEGEIRWSSDYIKGYIDLYIDGENKKHKRTKQQNIRSTDTPLTIGRQAIISSSPGTDDRHLDGTVDNVRLWRYALTESQIDYFRLNPVPNPAEQPGLAAFWAFNEGRGDRISDSAGGSTGKITGMRFVQAQDADELWVPTPFDADWKIYINGTEADCYNRELLTKDTSANQSTGLVIGAEEKEGSHYAAALNAFLGEVQIWNTARIGEDISRTMTQPAVGLQEGLQGYYRFNDGSGEKAADSSGNNYDAVLRGEEWFTANNYSLFPPFIDHNIPPIPIRDETSGVVTISNGYISDEATALNIAYRPSVVEDRSSQSRIYTYLTKSDGDSESTGGEILLQADVPLAETELVYLGQMQYKPRLIGFIEGAPPVPSENLTIDSSGTPDRYLNNSLVRLNRSDTASISADADIAGSLGSSDTTKVTIGLEGEGSLESGAYEGAVVGGGFEGSSAPVLKGKANITVTKSESRDTNRSYSKNAELNNTVNKSFALSLDGGWENNCYTIPGNIDNKRILAGQRLYRPNNMGSAIVKSRTADLFAVRSKKTQAMLGYQIIPNPEIPEDINILMFKINPQYIKNGTLDGYIGFDKDIDYNNLAAGQKGSFFKPEEAYRLKSTIERETRRAASDLSQYNPLGGFTSWHDKLTRQSLVNTYVWTADGGTLSLESQFSTSFQESFSGGLDTKGSIGGNFSFELNAGFGVLAGMSASLDVLVNTTLNLNYSHSDGKTTAISLNSEVQGEGFLNRVLVPPTDFNTDPSQWSESVDELRNNSTITQDDTPSLYSLFANNNITLSKKNYVTPEDPNADPTTSDGPWIVVDLYTRYKIVDNETVLQVSYWPVSANDSQYNINYDFASPPCPGKVRGYRFMSFYLAPNKNNFNAFFAQGDDQIVDPEWLASTDPDAVALRQAAHVKNEVWRVMHRVTYVNRVPPSPQDLPAGDQPPQAEDVAASPVRPDDHSIRHNSILVSRVLAAAYDAGTVTTHLEDLDFDTLTLNNADFDAVADELNAILTDMGIDDEPERTLYFNEMMTFFQLLLTPNEKKQAD
jgi:hypothetical protein